jgi:uncharacterized protein (DUF433 family)
MNNLLSRISINQGICHGSPSIRSTRYTVSSILEYLAGGDSIESITKEFTDLNREDVLACIAYAAESLKYKDIKFPAI